MSEYAGLQDLINAIEGVSVSCHYGKVNCGFSPSKDREMVIGETAGAEIQIKKHPSGIEDQNRNKWWVFVECPGCGYQTSYKKLLKLVKNDV